MSFMSDWKHHPISTQGIIMNHLHELKLKVIFKLHKTGHLPTHVKMMWEEMKMCGQEINSNHGYV